jgi:hypothetical protein
VGPSGYHVRGGQPLHPIYAPWTGRSEGPRYADFTQLLRMKPEEVCNALRVCG